MSRMARALVVVATMLAVPACTLSGVRQMYEQETLQLGRVQRTAEMSASLSGRDVPPASYRAASSSEVPAGAAVRRRDLIVVYFDVGSSSIDGDGERALRSFVHELQARPETLILVEGFADGTGSEAADAGLPDQRARAVADFLRGAGIPAARLASHGIEPGDASITPPDRLSNRRVDVRVR